MPVLVFKRLTMPLVLAQPLFKTDDLLLGCVAGNYLILQRFARDAVRCLFLLQGQRGALQLFLQLLDLPLHCRLRLKMATLFICVLDTHYVAVNGGLGVQSRSQALDEVLQRITDGCLASAGAAILLFEFLQVFMDRGLRSGITQRDADRIHRRMLLLSNQSIPCLLDI